MLTLTRRAGLALALALTAAPALGQTPAANPGSPSDPYVKLHTTEGDIVLELYASRAPITVKNFLHYVETKRFDGAAFFRASKPKGSTADDYGIVEGGLQNAPKKLFPPIAHESTARTGLSHTDGVISMARNAPGTAQANFTICVGDQTYLDADPKDPKANPGYAAFGKVVSGMDVVRKMLVAPTDPRKGTGVMKGEILAHPVTILSARRTAAPPIPPPAAAAPTPPALTANPS